MMNQYVVLVTAFEDGKEAHFALAHAADAQAAVDMMAKKRWVNRVLGVSLLDEGGMPIRQVTHFEVTVLPPPPANVVTETRVYVKGLS